MTNNVCDIYFCISHNRNKEHTKYHFPYEGIIDINYDNYVYIEIVTANKCDITIIFNDLEYNKKDISCSGNVYSTQAKDVFRDCFGESNVCVFIDDDKVAEFICSVRVTKIRAIEVEGMVDFLCSKSNFLIENHLSRTVTNFDLLKSDINSLPLILEKSDLFIKELLNNQTTLKNKPHKKLIVKKLESWKSNKFDNISPVDILENLDSLIPYYGDGDVKINGRNYLVGDMLADNIVETVDTLENQVLLGGLYFILRKIKVIVEYYNNIMAESGYSKALNNDYVKIDYIVIAKLTSTSMLAKCKEIIRKTNELIYFFNNVLELRFDYKYSKPEMTPYVRSSKLYRRLFDRLQSLYQIDNYDFNKNKQFLMKLKSLSKIFELFCFYKLVESIHNLTGYSVCDYKYEDELLCLVDFSGKQERITLMYEPRIDSVKTSELKHLDLVDIKFHKNNNYLYLNPDFVIKHIDSNNNVSYIILDAKYSRDKSVINYGLPQIIEKYYLQTGVYDARNKTINKNIIYAVVALYPLDNESYNKRIHYNLSTHLRIIPFLGAIPINSDDLGRDNLDRLLGELLNYIHDIHSQRN